MDIDGAVDMASTLGVAGVVTANAGVVVDNFTLDGTTLKLSSGVLRIENNDIRLKTSGDETMLRAIADGSVELMHNNVKTFATNSSGIELGDNDGTSILRAGGANTHLTLGAMGVSGTIKFGAGASNGTIGSTKMTLDASGNLLVGKSASSNTTVGIDLVGTQGQINSVTTDAGGAQQNIFLNRQDSDGTFILFRKANASVGSIGTKAGDFVIGSSSGSDAAFRMDGTNNQIYASDTSGAARDGAISLGASSVRWKDLYLSGGVYLGGTGSANKISTYEHGTWTPQFGATTSDPSINYNTQVGEYVRVGQLLHISFYIYVGSGRVSGGSGNIKIKKLTIFHTRHVLWGVSIYTCWLLPHRWSYPNSK